MSKTVDIFIMFILAIIIFLLVHQFDHNQLMHNEHNNSLVLFIGAPTIIAVFLFGNIVMLISNKSEQYNKINIDLNYAESIINDIMQNQNTIIGEIIFLWQENLVPKLELKNKIHDYLSSQNATNYNDLIKIIELKDEFDIPTEKLLLKKKCFLNNNEYISKSKLNKLAQTITLSNQEFSLKLTQSKYALLKVLITRFSKIFLTLISMIIFLILRSRI